MLVGLTVLCLGLALSMHAGAQALKAAREANRLDRAQRQAAWALDAGWRPALEAGGMASLNGLLLEVQPLGAGEGWAVCRVSATPADRRSRPLVTYRFCPPRP